jgi:hypothetical protein
MKKIISNFLWLALLVFLPSCYQDSAIKEIYSFNEVDFNTIQPDTLVIFDVDDTLIQPKDAYLTNEHTPQGQAFEKKLLKKYPEIKNWDYLASIMLQQAELPLIEPCIIPIINALKKRNIPVIACTSMNTGPYGILPTMEQWRYEQLKSLGFEGSYADKIIHFDSFTRKPVFYKGILATDLALKGPPLGAFLNAMQLRPKKIIMFDDIRLFNFSARRM